MPSSLPEQSQTIENPATRLKVGLVQMASGADLDANLATAAELIAEAATQGARLVALPEYFYSMAAPSGFSSIVEGEGHGPIQDRLKSLAKRHGIFLLAGSLPLRVPKEPRMGSGSLLFSPDGRILARYDKRHLFDHQVPESGEKHRESDSIAPGRDVAVARVDDATLGFSICYDLRFPEHFRSLVALGAEILAVPSAFTEATGKAHWHVLLRARAIENLSYVIAPAQAGAHPGGKRTYGHSLIVDPWGDILAEAPAEGACTVLATLDMDRLRKLRQDFPVLLHRKS